MGLRGAAGVQLCPESHQLLFPYEGWLVGRGRVLSFGRGVWGRDEPHTSSLGIQSSFLWPQGKSLHNLEHTCHSFGPDIKISPANMRVQRAAVSDRLSLWKSGGTRCGLPGSWGEKGVRLTVSEPCSLRCGLPCSFLCCGGSSQAEFTHARCRMWPGVTTAK